MMHCISYCLLYIKLNATAGVADAFIVEWLHGIAHCGQEEPDGNCIILDGPWCSS